MSSIQDVVDRFNNADSAIKSAFPKVDPRLVVSLIFDKNAGKKNVYTLDIIIKPDQDTDAIRTLVLSKSGVSPGFYLNGTKMIVSHPLDLEFLKWINDQDGVVSVKGALYSAGGSTDF